MYSLIDEFSPNIETRARWGRTSPRDRSRLSARVLPLDVEWSGRNSMRILIALFTVGACFAQTKPIPEHMRFSTGMRMARVSPLDTLSTSVVGTSNTQAILAYTAPDSNPCTVHVSENAGLTPLVHDVDTALFTGADSDSRTGAFSATTSRIFVAGKRMTDLGLDSAYYSRALQANTTHYYSIACAGATVTGSFATTNIPIGNTHNELVHVDPATGSAIIPTFPDDRTTTVIDEQTGALVKRVNIDAEGLVNLYSGGRIPMCGYQLVGPGPGYLCGFPRADGSPASLYYIIPTTGEVRYLGIAYRAGLYGSGGVANVEFDPTNALYWYKSIDDGVNSVVLRFEYTGDFTSVPPTQPENWPSINPTWVTHDLKAALHAYDATFDGSKFSCGFIVGEDYAVIPCQRGIQDSYGWMFVMRMSDAAIIGGINIPNNPNSRWCGNHSTFIVANEPLVGMLPHQFSEGGVFLGPYETTMTADITTGTTTFTVASEPLNIADAVVEPYFQDAAIGDWFILGGTELVEITGKSGTIWTVSRPYTKSAWVAGTSARAWCKDNPNLPSGTDMWWKFLDDPTGAGSGYFGDQYMFVGHKDVEPTGQISERDGVIGPIMSSINVPFTFRLSLNPTFAGVWASADGNGMSTYPTYQQLNATAAEKQWFLDEPTFFGADQMNGGATLISGQLYQYHWGTLGGLHRKQKDTLAAMGDRMLTDISSPSTGNILGTTSVDNYKYCHAEAVNECRTGSSVADVYFNVPGLVYTNCGGYETGDYLDICITDLPYGQGAFQFGFHPNTVGIDPGSVAPNYGAGYTRKLSTGFGGIKDLTKKFKPTAAAEWAFLAKGAYWNAGSSMLMLKMPPFPTPDGVDRSTFVRAPISITTPQGLGIATATVEFGYVEQGTPMQYYCTSRREACVAVASTVTDATPFWYKATDTYAKASCATSCTITLPVLPLHVAYYQVKFYDAAGTFVQNGATGVALEYIVR
jgi:hypothetical protein